MKFKIRDDFNYILQNILYSQITQGGILRKMLNININY